MKNTFLVKFSVFVGILTLFSCLYSCKKEKMDEKADDIIDNPIDNKRLPVVELGVSYVRPSYIYYAFGRVLLKEDTSTIYERGVCWDILPMPTVDKNKIVRGNGFGDFTISLNELEVGKSFYIRAFARNSAGIGYSDQIIYTKESTYEIPSYLNQNLTYGSVTDIDGNNYATIKIGSQIWMAQNLKTSRYNDGTTIPYVNVEVDDYNGIPTDWDNLPDGWVYYNNDSAFNKAYGKLYSWQAIKTGKLCPQGWHVPTDKEWIQLTTFLGNNVADKLKATGSLTINGTGIKGIWAYPNINATNESGFTALPAGELSNMGFGGWDLSAYWWTSTENNTNSAWFREVSHLDGRDNYGRDNFARDYINKRMRLSCRCVKD